MRKNRNLISIKRVVLSYVDSALLGVSKVSIPQFQRAIWENSMRVYLPLFFGQNPQALPAHLLADEKHSWRLRERIFIPTTLGSGCFLDVDIVQSAETTDLVKGYGCFRDEA